MEEPWLRGPIAGVDVMLAPVLYAFRQAREDLARHTEGISDDQLWAAPFDSGSVGFHLRHIAGSTDRLMTYLQGLDLREEQMAGLEAERQPHGAGRDELLAALDRVFERAEAVVRAIDPATLAEPRTVGRKRLPSTVIGLLTHIAEHTQRHVGAIVILARVVRSCR